MKLCFETVIILLIAIAPCWASTLERRLHELYDAAVFQEYQRNLDFSRVLWGTETKVRGATDNSIVINYKAREFPTQLIDLDVKALIYCHELGHLLGEGKREKLYLPFRFFGGKRFSSIMIANEGEADFFVGQCLHDYFSYDSEKKHLRKIEKQKLFLTTQEFEFIERSCLTEGDELICQRSLLAVKSFARLAAHFEKRDSAPLLYETSPNAAKDIYVFHSDALCRMETLVRSVLGGGRPSCWYNPQNK